MPFRPISGFPWRICALTALAASTFLSFFAPEYLITSSLRSFFYFFVIQISLTSIYQVILYPKFLSSLRNLPRPSGGSFFNGHFSQIIKEPTGYPQKRWNNEIPNNGLIYYTHLFNSERLVVTGPKALAEVLVHKNYDFIKPKALADGIGRLLGIGILLAEGDEHKIQRKNLMPAFAYRHVKDLYPVFWSKSCELAKAITTASQTQGSESVQDLKNAPVVEISGWASRATLDIIGVAGMGKDFDAIKDPDNELHNTYRTLFQVGGQASILGILSLILPFWIFPMLPMKRNTEIRDGARLIRRTCRQLIDIKKKKLENKEELSGVDIISVALESGGFTEDNLVDQMMTFLAAGHETTATAMTWAILLLCQNPEVQSRLREEIRAKLPSINDTDTPITAQILDQLPYLQAVCNEILRVKPPVTLTLRVAARDTSIQNLFVPAGTRIILSPEAVNMSPSLWGADASKFNPDRWLGEGPKAHNGGADSNFAYMTFLHGPRSCIGQAFAKAEFAFLLAAVVGRFEMELEDKERVIEIQGGITSKPKGGLPVRMRVVEGW